MSDDEQQLEEIEVLTSIFPQECEVVSGAQPRCLKILLVPHPPGGLEENHVEISLLVTMPPDYPSSSPPTMSIQVERGLSKKHADELKSLAERTAATDIGMPTIFLVCEALKEWLCDNNTPGQDGSMYSEMMRREQKKDTDLKRKEEKKAISAAADSEMADKIVDPEEEERIRRRQAGQPVTVESFNAWKAKFDEESRVAALLFSGQSASSASSSTAAAAGGVGEVRLTGKQLFLLNKASHEDGEDLLAAAEDEDPAAELDDRKAGIEEEEFDFGEGDDEDDDDDEDYVPGDDDDDDDDDFVDESEDA